MLFIMLCIWIVIMFLVSYGVPITCAVRTGRKSYGSDKVALWVTFGILASIIFLVLIRYGNG